MAKQRGQYHRLIKSLIQSEKNDLLHSLLKDLSSFDIAAAMLQVKTKYQVQILASLPEDRASEVLAEMSSTSLPLTDLVAELPPEQLGGWVGEMPKDDAADFVGLMDAQQADEVLQLLPDHHREEITSLLQYAQDTAGGIMNPYVISVQKEQSVEEAIRSIRQYIELQNSMQPFYTVYVVDEFQHLIGTVAVTQLLLAKRQTLISEMMNPDVIAVDVDLDQEEVVHIAKEYDLVVVPVIDKYLRLIGRITIDDLVDVIYEEHQEDIAQISGTAKEEVLEVSLIKTVRERLPWLMLGMLGGSLTALVMRGFEHSLIDIPQVTYFVPLIAAMAGNIGIQSSSIVVRGLATGAIDTGDLIVRVWRELRVGVLLGIVCSIVLGLMTFLLTWNAGMALTTPVSLLIVLCFAAVAGSAVPILLKKANIDPALAIGPFITTMNDLVGVWIYLTIAFQVGDWL